LWPFYFHCGNKQASTHVIINFICHQVIHHPSIHGTGSMGKHLRAKAHIAKLNDLTESEVWKLTESKVDKPAWAILNTHESCQITFVRSQLKVLFVI
jgi:hypothetical protein